MVDKGKQKPKPKAKPSKKTGKKPEGLPVRDSDIKISGSANRGGKLAKSFPTTTAKGEKLTGAFAGGGMVTFRFSKKSYLANEKDAIKLLNFYRKHLITWQAVKAWYAKGAIKNSTSQATGQVLKDRKNSQGWAGKGKVVGFSPGKSRSMINARMLNFAIRETQASVKAALGGTKGEYGQNLAIIFKPASFTQRGSPMEFELNLFFDSKGLAFYKSQQRLV